MDTSQYLTNVEWLSQNLETANLAVVDCHWDANAYLRAHIPRAIMRPGHAYIKSEDSDGSPEKFLPSPEQFTALMSAMGVGSDSTVVCYDEWENHFATRLWWLLRYYGHENVRILNGGWQAWVEKNLPVATGPSKPGQGMGFEARVQPAMRVALDELLANYQNPQWQVIDVRSDEEYDGRESAGNARVGHIPGAVHLEWNRMLRPEDNTVRRLHGLEEMQSLLEAAGVSRDKTIVTHCQSGVRATFMAYCLALLGYPEVKVYDGSMGEWANLDHTPLQ